MRVIACLGSVLAFLLRSYWLWFGRKKKRPEDANRGFNLATLAHGERNTDIKARKGAPGSLWGGPLRPDEDSNMKFKRTLGTPGRPDPAHGAAQMPLRRNPEG